MSKLKPKVYNLCWDSKRPGSKSNPLVIARHNTSTVSRQQRIGVLILYPALTTPEIVVGDQELELLLLTQRTYPIDRLRMRIRDQLKIAHNLDASKMVSENSLFVDPPGKTLFTTEDRDFSIESIQFQAGKEISTKSKRFSGYVDSRAFKIFHDAGYTNLYSVSMSNKVLRYPASGKTHSACGEPHDELIKSVLDRYNSWAWKDDNYHCFRDSDDDVDYTSFNTKDPIQSYHPVYYFDQATFVANVAHLSDTHFAARQQIMKLSKARVIDYEDEHGEGDLRISPNIGERVNICSQQMKQILTSLGSSSANLLFFGGDLVDYIRSCYPSADHAKQAADGLPSEIWRIVGLDEQYRQRYLHGVDLIAFFSVLINFLRQHSLPTYAITGNHDCYWEPYGISPRWHGHRANEGIPADHNLTLYEAILAFGETYATILTGRDTSFQASCFEWFYAVFTPFSDYSVQLPRQHLVAFGWGDREDFFDIVGGQYFGHLPRAKDGVSTEQLGLLDTAIKGGKRVILMTHFTFVSYSDQFPISLGDQAGHLGEVFCSKAKNWNDYNNGTFEIQRPEMLVSRCAARQIQVVLTGHSHRQALYLIQAADTSYGRQMVTTRHLQFKNALAHPDIVQPAIVVSDSGGTIPRFNLNGEFNGWGSGPPSGTVIEFDSGTGKLAGIAAHPSNCRPRAAAALDYGYLIKGMEILSSFQSDRFPIGSDRNGKLPSLAFTIEFNTRKEKDLTSAKDMSWLTGFSVESLTFYANHAPGRWRKIELSPAGANRFAMSSAADTKDFAELFVDNKERTNFLAMKLKPPGYLSDYDFSHYNFEDPWCWEFRVRYKLSGQGLLHWSQTHKTYLIERNRDFAEVPDFDTRAKYMEDKYARGTR